MPLAQATGASFAPGPLTGKVHIALADGTRITMRPEVAGRGDFAVRAFIAGLEALLRGRR